MHKKATRRVAGDFLRHLAEAVPYKVNIVLTDNGTHFTEPTGDGWTPEDIKAMRAEGVLFRCHSFEAACALPPSAVTPITAVKPSEQPQPERPDVLVRWLGAPTLRCGAWAPTKCCRWGVLTASSMAWRKRA